ncbi:hypothetical protein NLI96_g12785 [Meripilus lineatus]|uniref:DNA 3'-5' helicase n=1 Tax=Meripilus lineatus TaxID=2056292 RepID=A0AAD5YC27_9APHY|nr:hypothetical protein NLI96_g12785 [Physisporinus lineatus]
MAIPKLSEIKKKAEEVFERTPCLWQLKVAETILERKQDVVCVAGTGSGKTLTFWLPLLFREGIQVVFTPLNILGAQNVSQLKDWGIEAISISAKTVTSQNLKVDIEAGKYRVVVVNPEMALGKGCTFERVWRNKAFSSKLISVVWDEAHCISAWGSFREEYRDAAWLRTIIPRDVPYLVPSATLSGKLCGDVMGILEMDRKRTKFIRRSNDRSNVFIDVRKIEQSLSSFRDLMFLIPEDWKPSDGLPKFLIFFDNITESIAASEALRARLPEKYRDKLVWFNSNNTQNFREVSMDKFRKGKDLWALCCTDSFGMGIDLADIEIIVQWKLTCNLDTLWQRFGRAARGAGRFGIRGVSRRGKLKN